jgi:acetyltransferase-like isoleucine patch superfamily enzyme
VKGVHGRATIASVRTLLVRQAHVLFPFARLPDACGLGFGTFADFRARTLRALKLPDAVDTSRDARIEGPALVLADDVWVTRRALAGFLALARRETRPSRLALKHSRLTELFAALQDNDVDESGRSAFDVAYVPAGHTVSAGEMFSLPSSSWIAPPFREVAVDVRVSPYIFGRGAPIMTMPLTSTIAMRVRHWVHVLRAAHLLPQVELLERASSSPMSTLLRGLFALRATKRSRERALKAAFVYRGRGTFIHPTACVEASVLGDDVYIGAHAYVTGSVLGHRTYVEERAHVNASTVGNDTYISRNSTISACNVFGDTDACTNGIQGCVIAERSGFTSFARPLDVVYGADVSVLDGEVLRSAGPLPCGVAFGADVFVGAGVTIAPGRAVPPGVRLVMQPDDVLRTIPADTPPGSFATIEKGALRVLASSKEPALSTTKKEASSSSKKPPP